MLLFKVLEIFGWLENIINNHNCRIDVIHNDHIDKQLWVSMLRKFNCILISLSRLYIRILSLSSNCISHRRKRVVEGWDENKDETQGATCLLRYFLFFINGGMTMIILCFNFYIEKFNMQLHFLIYYLFIILVVAIFIYTQTTCSWIQSLSFYP